MIAAIHGVALGGGFQIALGADIRYVAPDARLAIMEIKWGIVPDMGGIALMRELAPADVIRELAMTGRIFSGAEALAYGFATSLHADPLAAARATAKEIAARSPDAVRATKRLLNAASDNDAAAILLAEFEGAGGADRIAKSDRGRASGDGRKAGTIRGRRIDERARSSGLVLLLGDLINPVGWRLVDGDMGHGGGRRGAVPVLFACRDQDDVAGTNLLDRSALPLNATRAGGDDKNWPFGWVCHAVRARGSKVTTLQSAPATGFGAIGRSMCTAPVKVVADPVSLETFRLISTHVFSLVDQPAGHARRQTI